MKIAIAALLLLAGCPLPVPPSPVPPDASDASPPVLDAGRAIPDALASDSSDPAVQACAHLWELGCAVGAMPYCPAAFRLDPKFGANPQCVLDAGTVADLRRCNVQCGPPSSP